MAASDNFPESCKACELLSWTQLRNRNVKHERCGRWFCPTHLETHRKVCKGRAP